VVNRKPKTLIVRLESWRIIVADKEDSMANNMETKTNQTGPMWCPQKQEG
jgi:hypothetical protein